MPPIYPYVWIPILQILEKICHHAAYKVFLLFITIYVDYYSHKVLDKHATLPPNFLLGNPISYCLMCGLLSW